MAVAIHGHGRHEGDVVFSFMVLRMTTVVEPARVLEILRSLDGMIPNLEAFLEDAEEELGAGVRIIGVPWEPPGSVTEAAAQRAAIAATEGRGVDAAWFFQASTSLMDIDTDDREDDFDIDEDDKSAEDELEWSYGPPPRVGEVRFPLDGYPEIIDDVDPGDFGIAIKLAGEPMPGIDSVLIGFHGLWMAPYGGRYNNTAVTFDRAHNAAHFWVDGLRAPMAVRHVVTHLLWVLTKLGEVVPIVHARCVEASVGQKVGAMGEAGDSLVLGGNPLLAVYSEGGDVAVDRWIASQTTWTKAEVAAMLRELAIQIVTSEDDDHDEASNSVSDDAVEDIDADDDAEQRSRERHITGYAGDVLRLRAAAGKLHPRAAEHLLPVLEVPERYEHRRQAVVDIMAALRHRAAAPALIKILETTTIKNALDSIGKEDLIAATAAALGALADAAAVPALARTVAAPGSHNDVPRPIAADALATCLQVAPEPRQVDDAVLDELLTTICERNDGELNAETHFAYGKLVRVLPPERRAQARRKLADADTARDDAIAMLARQAALYLASPTTPSAPPPRDLQPLLHEALTALDYDHEYTVRNLRVALRVAEIVPELVAPEDLVWLTRFAESDLRATAHGLLAKLGKPLPPATAFDRESVKAIEDADVVRWLAEQHVVGRAALIAEAGRRRLVAARPAIVKACHDVVARARLGGENLLQPDSSVLEAAIPFLREPPLDEQVIALFDLMLRHSNVHVKWELLEQVPRDPRLIGGMLHVLREKWGWQEEAARAWLAHFEGTRMYEIERGRMSAPTVPDEAGDEDAAAASDGRSDADDEGAN